MAKLQTEKYRVKDLDCASCAAKIEDGLKAVNGVNNVGNCIRRYGYCIVSGRQLNQNY
jgi:hypothetical protein